LYVVLLTGGLASGKDCVGAMLKKRGATLLDLDLIAKEEQLRPEVLASLQEEFGDDIVDAFGNLDRKLLAQRAFVGDESARRLNAICWPPVRRRIQSLLLEVRGLPKSEHALIVIEIPLLAEAPDFLNLNDEVISVVADEKLRMARAVARGMAPEDAHRRLLLQASDQERAAISDTVFENNGSLEELQTQVDTWFEARRTSGLF